MLSHNQMDPKIRAATVEDSEAVAEIYNHYVATTTVTFEEEEVSPSEMARRFAAVWSASLPWLVAEVGGQVAGYAYASRWHGRSAYRFSTEVTVYLGAAHARRGIGSHLYDHLFPILRDRGMHAVIAVIALPNEASVALHEKFGLEKIGHLKQVGYKFHQRIDVGYWQRIL